MNARMRAISAYHVKNRKEQKVETLDTNVSEQKKGKSQQKKVDTHQRRRKIVSAVTAKIRALLIPTATNLARPMPRLKDH